MVACRQLYPSSSSRIALSGIGHDAMREKTDSGNTKDVKRIEFTK